MARGNHITISGNVVADSQQEGNRPTTFTVAWNKSKKPSTPGGEWTYEGQFFDVVSWDKEQTFEKGTRVTIDGHIEQQRWTADDGSARSKIVIIADDVAIRPKTQDPAENYGDPKPDQEAIEW